MANKMHKLLLFLVIVSMMIPSAVSAQRDSAPDVTTGISFTLLHTNDVHGQLEASGSNPGMARVASVVNGVRTAIGASNVLLVDSGDEMQGSLLSNLQKGAPTIGTFNALGYNAATFGNHEFDWGQNILGDRTTQATYPFISANIVSGNCDATNWTLPGFVKAPYVVDTVGTAPNQVKVAFIGVTTQETPTITIASATSGLCFKDPAASILHYYDEMKAQADVIVVLSHLGYNDGGYGYGISVYGDKTLAQKLIDAGKPVPLIIGGHSHTDLGPIVQSTPPITPAPTPANFTVVGGKTSVVQAYYNGRRVGRADMTFDPATKATTVTWNTLLVSPTGAEDASVKSVISGYSGDAAYQALVNQPIGYTKVDLPRGGGIGDNMMGTFVDDAIYNYLNSDGNATNDVDIFFNNAGGIRTDWCDKAGVWSSTSTDCNTGTHDPMLLTYGNMFTILPFGNATVVGKMTGAQILEVVNYGPNVSNGVIQPAGLKYKYFAYAGIDSTSSRHLYAWGAYDICVVDKTSGNCDPLDPNKTYSVGTNEFLAPAGGDGYGGFKSMTNISYWGDMLNAVNAYVSTNYGTADKAYLGPNKDGSLDARITRVGNDTYTPGPDAIVPVTILHENDAHGNLLDTNTPQKYVDMTQLATLVKQERSYNSSRTLLVSLGDQIQGDAMMYYFKSAGLGYSADGNPLDPALRINPMIKAMNELNFDAMVLGNHEFNFGPQIFDSAFSQAAFKILGANMSDSGAYGVNKAGIYNPMVGMSADTTNPKVPVYDGEVLSLATGNADNPLINIGLLGLTNHRVPNYELPSNIPGLTFSNPIDTAKSLVPTLDKESDAVVALTHIGFTTNPKSVEVDNNVDTNLAAEVSGIDAIIGGHSHTNPTNPEAPYKSLPTYVLNPDGKPILINQAYRYDNYLGEVVLGMVLKDGKYQVLTVAGRDIPVSLSTTRDTTMASVIQPYANVLANYNATYLGKTLAPVDTTNAYIGETNAANLQADAAVAELAANGITDVDFHLSGAMTQSNPKVLFPTASAALPYDLHISDMFSFMPYENSLVVLKMNGPQIKKVLERGYRNYYYYKHVPGYGGYSYYTTCMLDINKGGVITYNDTYPQMPNGNNVVSLVMPNGKKINFNDAKTYYNVSTVNYLAAGSCNFNDNGVTLWPLSQTAHDTQYYVRDAVIHYVAAQGTIDPQVEGRLVFNTLGKSLFFPIIGR